MFNRTFCAFVCRDWYDPRTDGKEELKRFLSNHERLLMKPVLSFKGKGIELLFSKDIDSDLFYEDIKAKQVILEVSFISMRR